MAEINISTEAPTGKPGLIDISNTVEGVSHLLKSYFQLMAEANQFVVSDPGQCGRACDQTYALLVAANAQLDRLQGVPDALMDCLRAARMESEEGAA